MHTFGVWYFDWGWIIATLIGGFVGVAVHNTRHPVRNLALWCTGILIVGVLAAYGKYKC